MMPIEVIDISSSEVEVIDLSSGDEKTDSERGKILPVEVVDISSEGEKICETEPIHEYSIRH